MEIRDIVVPGAVLAHVKGSSKKALLQDIAAKSADLYGLEQRAVLDALLERERLGSTGLGRGVAAPHARIGGIDSVRGVFCQLDRGVDFEAPDDMPVDLVFALIAPEDAGAEHLLALAKISRALRDGAMTAKLRSCADHAALFAVLTEDAINRAA
jgi:PTS system nitrogen regulatory IIA component